MSEEIEFRGHGWYCPKCKKFRRIRGIYQNGTYDRQCKCGLKVIISVFMKKTQWKPEIVGIATKA